MKRVGPHSAPALSATDIPTQMAGRLQSLAAKYSPGECWPWEWTRTSKGYGVKVVRLYGKDRPKTAMHFLAHRAAYALAHGEAPAGLLVRHSCDRPTCCNPQHLLIGRQADNVDDMHTRRRGKWSGKSAEELSDLMKGLTAAAMPKMCRRIIDPSGKAWPSIKAAARDFGLSASCVSRRCSERRLGWRHEEDC